MPSAVTAEGIRPALHRGLFGTCWKCNLIIFCTRYSCSHSISPFKIFRDIIEAGMEEIAASQQQQVGSTSAGKLPDAVGSVAEKMHWSIDQSPSSSKRDTQREVPSHQSRSQRNRSRSRSQDRPSKHHRSERDKRDKRSATPRRSRKKSESPKHRRKEGKTRKHRHHSRSHSRSRGRSRERHSRKRSRSHSHSRGKRRRKSKSRSNSKDRERHRHKSKSRSESRERERHRQRSRSPNRLHSSSRTQEKNWSQKQLKWRHYGPQWMEKTDWLDIFMLFDGLTSVAPLNYANEVHVLVSRLLSVININHNSGILILLETQINAGYTNVNRGSNSYF